MPRALAKNPKLMLCDEPTGALDYITGKNVLKLLQDTCRSNGKTVVIITHNSAFEAIGDRVIRISNGTVTYNIYIVSPENAKGFTDYVTLYDPESKKNLTLQDNSAIITEKLSMDLKVGVRDTILVKYLDENEKHPFTITGITKNHAFNYVYFGKTAYQKAFGNSPEYNQFFAITTGGHTNDQIKSYLSSASGIGVISFTDDLMGNIRTSINSVNNIIWILIIAAGLLAFVVLYNLTNINIGESKENWLR